MHQPLKYDVEISKVREVTLVGTADLAYWRERLKAEGLYPTNAGGQAEFLICGSEMRFWGVRFRELIFAVFVSDGEDVAARDGVFLVHAFNSFWPFALIERTVFHTPYYHGQIDVDPRLPASLRLASGKETLLELAMARALASDRTPLRRGIEVWEGPIHLPSGRPDSPSQARLFLGKIGGPTEAFAFDPATDRLVLSPTVPILGMLLDSDFRPQEWLIRPSATHGKAKTIRRRDWQKLQPQSHWALDSMQRH